MSLIRPQVLPGLYGMIVPCLLVCWTLAVGCHGAPVCPEPRSKPQSQELVPLESLHPSTAPPGYSPPGPWPDRVTALNPDNIPEIGNIDAGYLDLRAQVTSWRRQLDTYSQTLPLKGGRIRTALDVGSGVGSFAAAAGEREITVLSSDIVSAGQPYQHVVAERGFLGIIHDARRRLPVVDRAFDWVHCSDVFHWFEPQQIPAVLRDWDRVLRPEGYVVLYFHQFMSPDSGGADFRARVESTEQSAQRLAWRTLKKDSWVAESTGEQCVRYFFQKPAAPKLQLEDAVDREDRD